MKFSRWLLFLFDLLIIGLAIISTYLYFIAPSMVYDRNSLALVAWIFWIGGLIGFAVFIVMLDEDEGRKP
jgi:RsiW-degrading membrane proteinase PrsW (M82 family)